MKTMSMRIFSVSGLIAMGLVYGGCQASGQSSYTIGVSAATVSVLNGIDSHLKASGAELDFHCSASSGFFGTGGPQCVVHVDGDRDAKIDAEVINRPFTGKPMVLRIHGGTQELQRSLYDSLGENGAPTNDFRGSLDERKLALEDKRLTFRCTASRAAQPVFECWTLVAAELLK